MVGWLIIKRPLANKSPPEEEKSNSESDGEEKSNSDSEDNAIENERSEICCGLKIKTPSSKKLLHKIILPARNLYGLFSHCTFGDVKFKRLVYKPEYRAQVLHHAVCASLDYVLFVVASKTKILYATLIFSQVQSESFFIEF